MAEVSCSRCGSTATGLDRAPLPGPLGASLLNQTCSACWEEWMETQVKLINEKRLSPGTPEHYDLLVREMRVFLNLREE